MLHGTVDEVAAAIRRYPGVDHVVLWDPSRSPTSARRRQARRDASGWPRSCRQRREEAVGMSRARGCRRQGRGGDGRRRRPRLGDGRRARAAGRSCRRLRAHRGDARCGRRPRGRGRRGRPCLRRHLRHPRPGFRGCDGGRGGACARRDRRARQQRVRPVPCACGEAEPERLPRRDRDRPQRDVQLHPGARCPLARRRASGRRRQRRSRPTRGQVGRASCTRRRPRAACSP